jgi:hypothetical protein
VNFPSQPEVRLQIQTVPEDRVLRRILGSKTKEVTEDISRLHSEERYNLRNSQNIKMITLRGTRWGGGDVTRIREMTNAYRIFVGKLERRRRLRRSRRIWEINNKVDLRERDSDEAD